MEIIKLNTIKLFMLIGFLIIGININAQQKQAQILVGSNILVSDGTGGMSNESHFAINPTDSKNIIGFSMFYPNSINNGTTYYANNRAYISHDGGFKWYTVTFLEEEERQHSGDPQVVFTPKGTAILCSYFGDPTPGLNIYRSDDKGNNWSEPVKLGRRGESSDYDHEMLAVDKTGGKFNGYIYISASTGRKLTNNTSTNEVGVLTSKDGGKNWMGPTIVASTQNPLDKSMSIATGHNPLIFSDGEVLVPIVEFPVVPIPSYSYRSCYYDFVTSKDGGETFTELQRSHIEGGGELKGAGLSYNAIDNSDGKYKDRIYTIWMDPADHYFGNLDTIKSRIWFSYSSNRGKTWSQPKMIGKSETGVQGYPASMAVNKDGTLGISWYDAHRASQGGKDIMIDRYFTASTDGGETFLPSARVSSVSTNLGSLEKNLIGFYQNQWALSSSSDVEVNSNSGKGFMLGHYISLVADAEGTFHEFWTDGRTGTLQIWTAAIQVKKDGEEISNVTKSVELVNTDVTKNVEFVFDPIRQFSSEGILEIPIRLRNISNKPIYAPLTIEITGMFLSKVPLRKDGKLIMKDGKYVYTKSENKLLNADNGKPGEGAVYDFTKALGDFKYLSSGAISGEVLFRFKKPTNEKGFPNNITFKVMAQVEKEKK